MLENRSDNRVVSARGTALDWHSGSDLTPGYTPQFRDKTPITPSKVCHLLFLPIGKPDAVEYVQWRIETDLFFVSRIFGLNGKIWSIISWTMWLIWHEWSLLTFFRVCQPRHKFSQPIFDLNSNLLNHGSPNLVILASVIVFLNHVLCKFDVTRICCFGSIGLDLQNWMTCYRSKLRNNDVHVSFWKYWSC